MKKILNEQLRKFNYLVGEIGEAYHAAALKLGLSDSAMSVMYTLLGEGGACRLSNICRLTGVSKQTVNSALRKLEADGIIRLNAVDGKQKSAELTEKGAELADATVAKLIAAENRIFGAWSERERSEYLRLTRFFLDEMKKEINNL